MDKAAKRLDGILIDLIEATQVKQRTIELREEKEKVEKANETLKKVGLPKTLQK